MLSRQTLDDFPPPWGTQRLEEEMETWGLSWACATWASHVLASHREQGMFRTR